MHENSWESVWLTEMITIIFSVLEIASGILSQEPSVQYKLCSVHSQANHVLQKENNQ